jgi:hypothetical protein
MVKAFFLLLTLAAAVPARAELTQIGAAAAVSGSVQAAAPGAVGRIVQSGKPLYLNDHVTTDDKGHLQVLLADETVFTLGPNSDMVLDEFVYDPASGTGKVAAKITKGAFRFVTGKVARKDPEKMKVKLSVGTIGIRGTTVVGSVDPVAHVDTVILMDNGMAVVNTDNGSVWLRAPGLGTTMNDPSRPPQMASLMSPVARQIMGQIGQLAQSLPGTAFAPPPSVTASGSGQQSAGELAGQNTANLYNAAQTSLSLQTLAQLTNTEITQTVQTNQAATTPTETFTDSTWEDMLSDAAASLNTVVYSANGTYSGTVGGVNATDTMNMALLVDFANRTYGDGNGISKITLDNVLGPGSPDTVNISQTDFSSLSGPAKISLSSGYNSDNPYFDGTTITFQNSSAGGIAAKAVTAVTYTNNETTTVSGTMSGTHTTFLP